jgi:hypothetical protein
MIMSKTKININGNKTNVNTLNNQMTSQKKISRPSDDPDKKEKLAAIREALADNSVDHPVFYQDEVDIHLNPKIGADWGLRGEQRKVATPGQNKKHYLDKYL